MSNFVFHQSEHCNVGAVQTRPCDGWKTVGIQTEKLFHRLRSTKQLFSFGVQKFISERWDVVGEAITSELVQITKRDRRELQNIKLELQKMSVLDAMNRAC